MRKLFEKSNYFPNLSYEEVKYIDHLIDDCLKLSDDTSANKNLESFKEILDVVESFISKEEKSEFVKGLLTQKGDFGFSLLMIACANNSHELVKEIFNAIEKFVPENETSEFVKNLLTQQNDIGFSPLMIACANNSHESVKFFLIRLRNVFLIKKRKVNLLKSF